MVSVKSIKRSLRDAHASIKRLSKYGRLTRSDPKVLQEVLEIIPDAWLFAGTLLGAIRDRKIIQWDGDIDIGCSCKDVSEDTLNSLRRRGFIIKSAHILSDTRMFEYIPEYIGKIGKIVAEKNGTKIEICCFADGIYNHHLNCDVKYFGGNGNRLFILPEKYIYPTNKFDFYGFQVNIPKNFESQLSFIYGESWRTPRRDWYCTADHYLCRERTIIELGEDDGSKWSKWTGRRVIQETYGPQSFPEDINEPFSLK